MQINRKNACYTAYKVLDYMQNRNNPINLLHIILKKYAEMERVMRKFDYSFLECVSKFIFPSIMQEVCGCRLDAQIPNNCLHAYRNGWQRVETLSA